MTITNLKYIAKDRNESRKLRVYFFPEKESIMDNLLKRRSRPVDEYRRLLPKVFTWAGLPADTKASWSQRAGCRCGCSPGFVLNTTGASDLFVDVTNDPEAEDGRT